jgi:hypothetical protein
VVTVAVGVLVFLLVSRRCGQWVGLACASVVLLLGPAWEDLLFFGAAIDIEGSLATGLAALWLLERDRPLLYPACLLLACSVGFSNVGVPFALGAAVVILLRRRPRQLWVPAVPLALFAVWWAVDGHRQPSHLSGHNIVHLPKYVLDSVSSGLASLTGLHGGTASAMQTSGRVELGLLAVALVVAGVRGWRPRPAVLVPLVVALGFWCLTGASYYPGREPFASRYQMIDVVLLVLIGAELVGPVRLGRTGLAALGLVTVAIIGSNLADRLAYGYRFLREESGFVKADLGALELGRRLAPANLWLLADIAHSPYLSGVIAGPLFAETAAHGNVPVYTPRQIAVASAAQRLGADNVLALAERLSPVRAGGRLTMTSRCGLLRTGAGRVSPELVLSPGTWLLSEPAGGGLGIGVARFAPPGSPAYIGLITPGLIERMSVPPDGIPPPWRLSIKSAAGAGSLRVCPA